MYRNFPTNAAAASVDRAIWRIRQRLGCVRYSGSVKRLFSNVFRLFWGNSGGETSVGFVETLGVEKSVGGLLDKGDDGFVSSTTPIGYMGRELFVWWDDSWE